MPYAIEKRNSKFCVINQQTGAAVPGGCHAKRPDAVNHMRALYANVSDAGGKSGMLVERKAYPILGLKSDDETGIIEAIVSVFNNVDSGKEIVRQGFFTKSIAKKLPKGVWAHDWKQPIAKTLEAKEVPPGDPSLPTEIKELGGTYIKGQFNLDTQRGREAYSDIKFGIVDEFSIGYKVTKESKDEKTGARELLEGDWKEWSPVLVGMNDRTQLLSIKSEEEGIDEKAQWTSSYISNLPDSAFAYIEDGGQKDDEGKTKPRSLRHFPYKDANGNLDEAHIRNALARIPQSKLSQAAKDAALKKIEAAAKKVGIDTGKSDDAVESKALFEDVLEEREESLYFLFDVLCMAIYRAQMLDETSEDTGDGSFDLAAAMDEILSEFSARVKDAIAGPEEEGEEDSGDAEMASLREPISFKGDLRAGSTFATTTKTVLAAVEVFAKRSAALAEFIEEFNQRSAAIMETRFKDGRMYSANNLSQMQRVHGAMGKVKKDVAAIHADMGTLIQRAQKPEKSEVESLRTQSLKVQSTALSVLNG